MSFFPSELSAAGAKRGVRSLSTRTVTSRRSTDDDEDDNDDDDEDENNVDNDDDDDEEDDEPYCAALPLLPYSLHVHTGNLMMIAMMI